MLKILLLILVGLGIIVSVIVLYGTWHWQAGTEAGKVVFGTTSGAMVC